MHSITEPLLQLLREPEVLKARGCGKSKFRKDIALGLFTKPVKRGPKFSAWPAHEVNRLQAAIIAGCSDDEIRELVSKLETDRSALLKPNGVPLSGRQ